MKKGAMNMRKNKRLSRKSKIERIMMALAGKTNLTLKDAAKIAYGATNEEAQMKVVRLLSAYRFRGKTDMRVRGGKLVARS